MAQGSIRKGFFFYFGLFVLLLVSIFLICLVIMMFNPGKTVLWMKYFSGNQTIGVTKTTGETVLDINYSALTDITINCNYANVTVQRNKEYSDDGIILRNNAKGFAGAKKFTPFSYSATLDGTKLTIDIVEPNGFLYFSKDIEVIINDNVTNEGLNLAGISVVVNAEGNSDITLGGQTNKEEAMVSLRAINLNTEKGDITITKMFNAASVSGDFKLYTGSGRIKALNEIGYAVNKSGAGIQAVTDVTVGTNKGRINFDFVNVGTRTLFVECKKGTVAIDNTLAGLVSVSKCVQGNYRFNNVNCDLTFEKAEDSIISPIISIDEIAGSFHLSATDKSDAPIITINKIEGNVSITAGKGSVNIAEACGIVDVTSSASMSVKVTVSDTNTNQLHFKNERGKIYVHFLGTVSSSVIVEQNSADVEIDFTKNASFTAYCYKNNGNATDPVSSSKVSVNINKDEVNYEYDADNGLLTFNGGSSNGNIVVNSNGDIAYNLVRVV